MTDETQPAPTPAPAGADDVPAVVVVRPGEGETLTLGTTRMRVLEDGSHTEHRLGLTESVLAPHTPGPPQHRHARHDEGFYVLAGTVRFTVGAQEHEAGPGTFVMVPAGAPHTFANPGAQPARMLSVFTPDLYVQYFRDLRDTLAGGRPPTPSDTLATMSRYATRPAAPIS
ncbi:cupin domain-containing protein [Streptomyces venezuelae]|uniref:Cupin domain-containing protein n=1 Tax=Streptomyces venezuelae TaxID=54571 RepID=A0A5P2BNN8_STRVZ|nr:cupin domain-containing protein [Streptomyces venezuelae]QES32086.1 cupin domain-containing protein [Streptomyces venezuelae]